VLAGDELATITSAVNEAKVFMARTQFAGSRLAHTEKASQTVWLDRQDHLVGQAIAG